MSHRLLIRRIGVRAALALGVVFFGYLALHDRFASFDAAATRAVLDVLGFDTTRATANAVTATAGDEFGVYAIVTGSCSSAAGALGIGAVALFLLPGASLRRLAGGVLAILAFAAFNVLRICSIVVLGWWLAVTSRPVALATMAVAFALCVFVATRSRSGAIVRVAALLTSGLFALLFVSVARGEDYTHGMVAYHALAGPAITFTALALALVALWRVVGGPALDPPSRPAVAT